MFDVMLIDDELDVRERVISMIDWNALPIRLVAQAADGETASELYLLHRPKILITDINIPILSGLELAEKFIALDPELQVIVITGYNDFGYAQRALHLGAAELLLKPIFPQAINDALRKAVGFFETLQKKRASDAAMEKLLRDNLPVIRETYLADLLHSSAAAGQNVREKLDELGIACPGPCYAVALCGIPRTTKNYEAMNLLAERTAKALLDEVAIRHYMFLDNHFRLNLLLNLTQDGMDNLVEETLSKLKAQMSFIAGVCLYVGIGGTVHAPEELNLSFDQALAAYRYQNILNDDTVIHYKNILSYENPISAQESVLENLFGTLRQGRSKELEAAMTAYFTALASERDGMRKMLDFSFSFIARIGSECVRRNINMERITALPGVLRALYAQPEPQDILNRDLGLAREFMAIADAQRTTSSNYLIDKAKAYMRGRLGENSLTMEEVADHIGLSRAYFCALFHKETGVSFSNYLKDIRVEKAKELLRTSPMKVLEISGAVGFSSAKYFSYVFRQVTGKTPLEYQKSASA